MIYQVYPQRILTLSMKIILKVIIVIQISVSTIHVILIYNFIELSSLFLTFIIFISILYIYLHHLILYSFLYSSLINLFSSHQHAFFYITYLPSFLPPTYQPTLPSYFILFYFNLVL